MKTKSKSKVRRYKPEPNAEPQANKFQIGDAVYAVLWKDKKTKSSRICAVFVSAVIFIRCQGKLEYGYYLDGVLAHVRESKVFSTYEEAERYAAE